MSSTATASRPPSVPHHLMVREIGRGSYGEIWLARSLTGAWRAVKIVARRRFEDERSFEREFAGMASFEPVSREHEGFVDILHVGRSDDDAFFYYVMELADDVVLRSPFDPKAYQPKTLKSELARVGRMPADQVIALGLSLTDALAELHGHALVHRDIKPANIIFCGGVPKIADIGLVSAMGQNSFVGTEGYVPPEGPGNEQSDIFSLGKVLYEIGMGKDRMQFPEMNTGLADFPDRELLLRLNEVLLRACAGPASNRYATAREMHEDLLRARDGKPLATRAKDRRRAGIAVFALLLIAAAVFAARAFSPAGKGGVFIEVEPPEAMVMFQGDVLRPPVSLRDVPEGEHELRIIHGRYENVIMPVIVNSGEETRPPKIILQRALRPLSVESTPPGLAFTLREGENPVANGTTPQVIPQLSVGTYTLEMTHEGRSKTLEVSVEKEETPVARIAFGKKQYVITSRPAGAEIFCDGKLVGTAPCTVDLPEGVHKLVARYKSWPPIEREITAVPDGPEEAQAFAFTTGSVKIASRPKGAAVFSGGVRVGTTPCIIENLEPGEATFTLKLERYRDGSATAVVRPGQTEFAEVDFEKRPGPRAGTPWENGLGMKFVPAGDLLFCVWPVRVADFAKFCELTGRPAPGADFPQTPDHPVINVNWEDARAFCQWLTSFERSAGRLDENQIYRLPSDAEWSAAAGLPNEGGNTPEQRDGKFKQYPWGTSWPPPAGSGNYADTSIKKGAVIAGYSDGWVQTSPVGSFAPSASGLFDMSGNVWQWVEDSYRGGEGRKSWGVLRGGSWGTSQAAELQLGYRDVVDRSERDPLFGFRCVISPGN